MTNAVGGLEEDLHHQERRGQEELSSMNSAPAQLLHLMDTAAAIGLRYDTVSASNNTAMGQGRAYFRK